MKYLFFIYLLSTLITSVDALTPNASAQQLGAYALDNHHKELLRNALQQFAYKHALYQNKVNKIDFEKALIACMSDTIDNKTIFDNIVVVADAGFGDTIQFAYFLKQLNATLQEMHIASIKLYLVGAQKILQPMLERSGLTHLIIVETLDETNDILIPLIGIVNPHILFNHIKQPYLVPNQEAVTYWQKRLNPDCFNVVTKWRSGTKPVLGETNITLQRDIPLKMVIDIALQVDPNAHIYLIQNPPHHRIVTQSIFDNMTKEEQQANLLNVIPNNYVSYVTQVPHDDGSDPHGPFEDSLALMSLCTYIGSDTVTAHMSGNVAGGKTIMLLPAAQNNGSTNRDWRWGTSGTSTIWYNPETFHIFEIDFHDQKEIEPIITLLKKWHLKDATQN